MFKPKYLLLLHFEPNRIISCSELEVCEFLLPPSGQTEKLHLKGLSGLNEIVELVILFIYLVWVRLH